LIGFWIRRLSTNAERASVFLIPGCFRSRSHGGVSVTGRCRWSIISGLDYNALDTSQ
jgi:hypothetical protein